MYDIAFLGDILLADSAFDIGFGFTEKVKKGLIGNFSTGIIEKLDYQLIVANYEAVIADSSPNIGIHSVAHRLAPKYLNEIDKLPVNIFNVANNHILDHGIEGFNSTVSFLREKKIKIIGSTAMPLAVMDVGTLKVAILAASLVYDTHSYANKYYNYLFPVVELNSDEFHAMSALDASVQDLLKRYFTKKGSKYLPLLPQLHSSLTDEISMVSLFVEGYRAGIISNPIEKQIKDALLTADKCLVYLHWGNEYISSPAPWQRIYADMLRSYGVAAVIGCHSHVVQPSETIGVMPVVYSLGNTYFNTNNPLASKGKIAVVNIDNDSNIIMGEYGSRYVESENRTYFDSTQICSNIGNMLSLPQYVQSAYIGINKSRKYKRQHMLTNIWRMDLHSLSISLSSYLNRMVKRLTHRR